MKRTTAPKVKKEYRFYKSGLPAIVWDPEKNRAMADFTQEGQKGSFTTDNKRVAKHLRAKGYPEISVDATEPPNILVLRPGQSLADGQNVPILKSNISERVGGSRVENVVQQTVKAPEVVTE